MLRIELFVDKHILMIFFQLEAIITLRNYVLSYEHLQSKLAKIKTCLQPPAETLDKSISCSMNTFQ